MRDFVNLCIRLRFSVNFGLDLVQRTDVHVLRGAMAKYTLRWKKIEQKHDQIHLNIPKIKTYLVSTDMWVHSCIPDMWAVPGSCWFARIIHTFDIAVSSRAGAISKPLTNPRAIPPERAPADRHRRPERCSPPSPPPPAAVASPR
jgi:hypothetical protein